MNINFDIRVNFPVLILILADGRPDVLVFDFGVFELKYNGNQNGKNNSIHDEDGNINDDFYDNEYDDSYANNNNDSNIYSNDGRRGYDKYNAKKNTNNDNNNNKYYNSDDSDSDEERTVGDEKKSRKNADIHTNTNHSHNTQKSFYHTYNLKFSKIQILMSTLGEIKDNKIENKNDFKNDSKSEYKNDFKTDKFFDENNCRNKYSRLIEKFSINFRVQFSSNPWGCSSCPIKLSVTFPGVNIR